MQKRNYYRCGWIRFEDDVDVVDVNQKLSEAKVRPILWLFQSTSSN